ncbi:hypothetical protein HD554DRAFT_2042422 [Boletus coccyginus]|nr:hypothetical protein HD554DRAFT_2042422 [Boletus coccyginus]
MPEAILTLFTTLASAPAETLLTNLRSPNRNVQLTLVTNHCTWVTEYIHQVSGGGMLNVARTFCAHSGCQHSPVGMFMEMSTKETGLMHGAYSMSQIQRFYNVGRSLYEYRGINPNPGQKVLGEEALDGTVEMIGGEEPQRSETKSGLSKEINVAIKETLGEISNGPNEVVDGERWVSRVINRPDLEGEMVAPTLVECFRHPSLVIHDEDEATRLVLEKANTLGVVKVQDKARDALCLALVNV